jgi:hypothetical protein
MRMTECQTTRGPFAALALAAALICGAGAASAATVTVTLDFGTTVGGVSSPYIEDGFEVSGFSLFLADGNPAAGVFLEKVTTSLTLTRTGGGAFSLIRFEYDCLNGICDFTVGSTPITGGSSGALDFATAQPAGFTDITSLVFTWRSSNHLIDNIVLSYDDLAPIPLPAGLPLLLGGLAGLGLVARRKGRAD